MKILHWTNPDHNTDGSNYDQATQGSGYNLSFDGGPAFPIPLQVGTQFDISTLPQYAALPAGAHTVQIQVVAQTGEVSAFSLPASPFTINTVPNPPFDVAVLP